MARIAGFRFDADHDNDLYDDVLGDDDDDEDDDLTSRAHHIGSYSWRGEKIVHCA